jgi:hypothetical protein
MRKKLISTSWSLNPLPFLPTFLPLLAFMPFPSSVIVGSTSMEEHSLYIKEIPDHLSRDQMDIYGPNNNFLLTGSSRERMNGWNYTCTDYSG